MSSSRPLPATTGGRRMRLLRNPAAGLFLVWLVMAWLVMAMSGFGASTNWIALNSSFEVGLKGFHGGYAGVYQDRAAFAAPFSQDTTTAAHGRASLKLDAHRRGRYRFASQVYELSPGTRYTLSFYAKADKPLRLPMMLTATAGAHDVGLTGAPLLSSDWKRHSISGMLTVGNRYAAYKNRYFLLCFFPAAPDATIWLDAIQLEAGDLTPYRPGQPAHVALDHPVTGHLWQAETVPAPAVLRTWQDAPGPGARVDLALSNAYTGEVLFRHTVALPDRAAAHAAPVPLPALPRGCYHLRAELRRGEAIADTALLVFACITPRPPAEAVPPDRSYLGVHGGPAETRMIQGWNVERDFWFNEAPPEWTYALLRDLGIHWQRLDALSYPMNETAAPERGRLYDRHIEDLAQLAAAFDLRIMAVLGVGADRGPAWMTADRRGATGGPLFDLEGLRLYAAGLARAAPGIRCWETFNEPNCYFTPEEFLDLHRTVAAAIKSVQPEAVIVGGSATADLGANAESALGRYLELGLAEATDVVSVHGHYGPTPLFLPALVARVRAAGKPVWDTELQLLSHSQYPEILTLDSVARVQGFALARPPRDHAIESIVTCMDGLANGLERCFIHAWWSGAGNLTLGDSPSWFEYDLAPRPVVPAMDAFLDLADGGRPLGLLDLGGDTRCFLVECRGRPTAFLQLEKEMDTVLDLPPDRVACLDLMGNPLPTRRDDAGRLHLALGRDPVYLVGRAPADLAAITNALLRADFETTLFSASGPRLGLDARERPALLCRVVNEGAMSGLSGRVTLTRLPRGLRPARTREDFAAVSLRAHAEIVFPVALEAPGDRNRVAAAVEAKGRRAALARTIRLLTAVETRAPVTLDGQPDDWPDDLPEIALDAFDEVALAIQGVPWAGPADCSARLRSQWDRTALYLLATVRDERVMRDPAIAARLADQPDLLYETDAVELFFDTDLMRDFHMPRPNQDDFQFVIAPALPDGTPVAVNIPACTTGLAREYDRRPPAERIAAVSVLTPDGYRLEVRIPWSVYGTTPLYERGMVGFNLAVDDDDTEGEALQAYTSERVRGRDLQMRWSGKGLDTPVTDFGVLRFVPAAEAAGQGPQPSPHHP